MVVHAGAMAVLVFTLSAFSVAGIFAQAATTPSVTSAILDTSIMTESKRMDVIMKIS